MLRWLLTEADRATVLHPTTAANSEGGVNEMMPPMTSSHSRSSPDGGNGSLALHYAAARGCLDCVKLLVESTSPEFR